MNANELGLGAPSLPGYLLYPVALLTGIIVLVTMARMRDRAAAFVIGASWLRYVMSAFHAVTYRPFVAGMSMNAAASIGVFLVGLMCINWRHLALKLLVPFYMLIAIAVASAIANRQIGPGLVTVVTKYGYLIVIMLAVYSAMKRSKDGSFMTALLWSFAPLLLFQALSIVFGISKSTEAAAGSVSFIGGYNHEAAFSVTLATCLTVACFAQRISRPLQTGIILACVVGIVLANYRTVLVAIAPILLMHFASSSLLRFPFRDRPFVVSALIVAGGIALGLAGVLFAERFQDVGVATSGDVNFFKPPEQYSVEESRLLSGRPRIWSMYIYGWIRGDLLNHIIGFGPESWSRSFTLYAHNTMINNLYEYGIVGVFGILFLWVSMLTAALRVRHPHRGTLIGAHLSFLVLNMSTMPMWMIEGNILYGIICGYTLYLLSLQTQQARRPQRRMAPAAPTPAAG